MSELGYVEAAALGVVQGLTEFLPISSSGHLAITQKWLALEPDSPTMLLFDVLAHLGTLLAVLIVLAPAAKRFVRGLAGELITIRQPGGLLAPDDNSETSQGSAFLAPDRRPERSRARTLRIAALAAVAILPTAVIGLGFKDTFEAAFDEPQWIGAALLVTGVLLALTGLVPRARRGWRRFGWGAALVVGIAQGAAIFPGISRSGATICTALLFGIRKQWAAEFSFLIAVPAILGASMIKIKDTFELPEAETAGLPMAPILVGSAISLVVGIGALKLLLAAVRRAKLHYFAPYCWLVGTLLLLGWI